MTFCVLWVLFNLTFDVGRYRSELSSEALGDEERLRRGDHPVCGEAHACLIQTGQMRDAVTRAAERRKNCRIQTMSSRRVLPQTF